jgi:hypothetical protein
MPRRSHIHDIYIVSGIFLSVVVIIVSVFLAMNKTSFLSKAAETSSAGLLSRENSYVFASPVVAQADKTSVIRITVYLLNSQGLGFAGQKVDLASSRPLIMKPISPVTDSFGIATYDVSSASPGSYTVSVEASGITLPQTVSISFR